MAWIHGYIDSYYMYYYETYALWDYEAPPTLDRIPLDLDTTPDALEEYLGSMLNVPWTSPVTNEQDK